ncbi:hypothetical protein WV31_19030 [Magnetospirillum sp. ME-1]|uniref:plasmid recombination protein n=1 Tax=Magnetospirillum sp. ME-1 TaxID=1639348 RepID=UPI000A17BEA7|nr:plasmid recombination protein [Magnetospirillum sp. ME-1]ARJ67598.1 hypothetical protein WV31_19030 [Magnetospirillum sp. ME-1]
MDSATNDNDDGKGPFCILRHGRKSHTWGELRQASQHTVRDPTVSWLGDNIDPTRSPLNEVLVGTGDVVEDVRVRLTAVGLTPKAGQVVARELLLSASHAHFAGLGQTGRDGDWDQDRLTAWKTATVDFLKGEFGDNLVTVSLHLDESVPHAHCWVTTAVNVEKKSRGRPRKDGTRPAAVMGWTLNHDRVIGSGKDAFGNRQDRYADAMAPLGLKRGQRHSKAHHQPIREFYAQLPAKLAAAEAEYEAAREFRIKAEQDAIRADILRQAGEMATQKARQAQVAAERSRQAAEVRQREVEEVLARASLIEQDQRAALAVVHNEKLVLADDKARMAEFMERQGQAAAFEQYRADSLAVANLRNGKGKEWEAYEKSLRTYADDLKRHGAWRDAMTRRADKPLRFLLEAGAQALGHTSIAVNPARFVSDGIRAWLRLVGGEELVRLHRIVVGWMREIWAVATEIVIEPRHREREWER